jgi:hypothetical protein
MTPPPDLAPSTRRKLVARALLRASANAAVLTVLYYVLPMDRASDVESVVLLAVGLAGVALLVAWETRAILRAEYPAIRGIEALALTVPLFLLLFAATYFLIEHASTGSFTQPLNRTDALYFTVTTFATVGYGDITAKSEGARVIVTFQMVTDLVIIGFGVRVLLGAVQIGRRRRAERHSGGGPSAAPISPGLDQED